MHEGLHIGRRQAGGKKGSVVGLLDGIRGKLSEANDAIADAHKAWKDERLDDREAAVALREAAVASREMSVRALEEEVRKAEARWLRQRIGFGLGALIAGVPALAGGVVLGSLAQHTPEPSKPRLQPAPSLTPTPGPVAAPSEAIATPVAKVGSGEAASASEEVDFDECIGRIERLSEQSDTAPINIVETSVLRIARFPADDGSVLISCSRPDRKMVITKSPYR